MKRNISIIYRISFILFSLWAILESAEFRIANLPVKLLNFTVLIDAISMICVIVVFFATLRGSSNKFLPEFKTACTCLALVVLASNLQKFMLIEKSTWILEILLPLMMVVDSLIFERGKMISLQKMLLWIFCAFALAVVLFLIAVKFNSADNPLALLGLFVDVRGLYKMLINTLILFAFLYLLNRLLSGEFFKDLRAYFVFVFRLLFLALEVWAFIQLSGMNLRVFLYSLRYFETFVNFLCFVSIVSVVLYNLVRTGLKKQKSIVLSRVKSCFTIWAVFAFVVYHYFAKGNYAPDATVVVLYYIAPAAMLFDWLFIEKNHKIRWYDPLLGAMGFAVYFITTLLLAKAGVENLYPLLFGTDAYIRILFMTLAVSALGYVLFFIDRFIKGRCL